MSFISGTELWTEEGWRRVEDLPSKPFVYQVSRQGTGLSMLKSIEISPSECPHNILDFQFRGECILRVSLDHPLIFLNDSFLEDPPLFKENEGPFQTFEDLFFPLSNSIISRRELSNRPSEFSLLETRGDFHHSPLRGFIRNWYGVKYISENQVEIFSHGGIPMKEVTFTVQEYEGNAWRVSSRFGRLLVRYNGWVSVCKTDLLQRSEL